MSRAGAGGNQIKETRETRFHYLSFRTAEVLFERSNFTRAIGDRQHRQPQYTLYAAALAVI
jgi:hypothetical protein